MKFFSIFAALIILGGQSVFSQTLSEIVEQVSIDGISTMLKELSGEQAVEIGGSQVVIQHRVSAKDNNLSAEYLKQRLESYGLNTQQIDYSSGGRNVVATQIGIEYPDQIYIVCGHYDSTNDHGADDNASGTIAVLETARILSQYQFKRTIIYALWDEEEIGLVGAKNYAQSAKAQDMNIRGVLNMDMMAYDSDNDRKFDIDVRDVANSYEMRDDLISTVTELDLNLNEMVVDPGTPASDHSAFWAQGYSAVLLGEAWSDDDVTPGYHSDEDRISLLNLDYYWEMVKLCVGYTTSKAELLTSAIPELINTQNIEVLPNPSTGVFNIDFGQKLDADLTVINQIGKSILFDQVNQKKYRLDLASFPNAMYFVRLQNKAGALSTFSIVKQ